MYATVTPTKATEAASQKDPQTFTKQRLHSRTISSEPQNEVSPIEDQAVRSAGPLQAGAQRASREVPFGHHFSRIAVHSQAPVQMQKQPPDAATWTTVERYSLQARVRRGPSVPSDGQVATAHVRSDASPGEEHAAEEYLALFEQLGAVPVGAESGPTEVATPESSSAVAPETPAPGVIAVPIHVPDIEIPQLAELAKNDAVSAAFTYRGSIRRGGSPPSAGEFGVTRSFNSRLTGITITRRPGTFQVAATLQHPITYQVRSRTGPHGQVDIASDTDRDITRTNYPTASSDLTPNMGDLNGRPPRTRFWARDLTLRHERVHANDDTANGPGAMAVVTTWLNSQIAPDVGTVRGLLRAVPGRFAAALLAALSTVAGERNAYGDGAPAYKARADAISAKGARGEYR